MFEDCAKRRTSPTQRAYRQDVLALLSTLGLPGRRRSVASHGAAGSGLVHALVKKARAKDAQSPVCLLASFYKYLGASVAGYACR
jgi:hypothetical protein